MEKILMNGIIIVLPILIIRFLLMSLLSKEAVKRAAFFPQTQGIEKMAYWINIITTFLLMVMPFFLKINPHGPIGITGLCQHANLLIGESRLKETCYDIQTLKYSGNEN